MRTFLLIPVLILSFLVTSTSYSSSIKFFNGYLLEEKESDLGGPPGKSYQLIDLNSKKIIDEFNTYRGKIKKIFYSSDNKEVVAVIINESDGGSGGWYEWDTLIYAIDGFVRKEKFRYLIELDVDIEGSYIKNLIVKEKIPTSNSIGDKVIINKFYKLILNKNSQNSYIVEDGVKTKYVKLLNMYVWDYLGSDDYRLNLIEEIGIKKFKEFREIITIGFSGSLVKKRFIVFQGSQKIYWENFALIIVDGITGKEVAIWYDDKLSGKIIDSKPFDEEFNNFFPFITSYPVQHATYKCIRFDSDSYNLSIKPMKSCPN